MRSSRSDILHFICDQPTPQLSTSRELSSTGWRRCTGCRSPAAPSLSLLLATRTTQRESTTTTDCWRCSPSLVEVCRRRLRQTMRTAPTPCRWRVQKSHARPRRCATAVGGPSGTVNIITVCRGANINCKNLQKTTEKYYNFKSRQETGSQPHKQPKPNKQNNFSKRQHNF